MGNAESQELSKSSSVVRPEDIPLSSSISSSSSVVATGTPTTASTPWNTNGNSILLQVPNDALHCIASFLTPAEWKAISCTSRTSQVACQSVFTRVRLHGFRCATEVASAWVSLFVV